MDVRHSTLQQTLESAERANRKRLREEQPEPKKGDGVTLMTAWNRWPATVILVEPRRMLVQEDALEWDEPSKEQVFRRHMRGRIHGFRRRLNSKKWTYASDWMIKGQSLLGVYVGKREYDEPDIYGMAMVEDVIVHDKDPQSP